VIPIVADVADEDCWERVFIASVQWIDISIVSEGDWDLYTGNLTGVGKAVLGGGDGVNFATEIETLWYEGLVI
jgi:hypothetical protein